MQVDSKEKINDSNINKRSGRAALMGFLVSFGLMCISQFAQLFGMIGAGIFKYENFLAELQSMLENIETLDGDLMAWGALSGGVLGILICLWVNKKIRFTLGEVLPLQLPEAKQWLIWIPAAMGFWAFMYYMENNTNYLESPFMEKILNSITNLPIAILGIGIIVPIFEEMVFRGFLFKGFEESWGGHVAVILSSILFVAVHGGQYGGAILLILFPLALILGYSRLYSKSLIIPIVIHCLNNSLAFIPS